MRSKVCGLKLNILIRGAEKKNKKKQALRMFLCGLFQQKNRFMILPCLLTHTQTRKLEVTRKQALVHTRSTNTQERRHTLTHTHQRVV